MTNNKVEMWQLQQRQQLPLEMKEKLSLERIKDFYEFFNGKVYISFSGGKDSLVLLHLVRREYPNVEGVCIGTEPPENIKLVKKTPNCIVLYPKIPMHKIFEEYGYPILSKEISKNISRFRNTKSQKMKEKYLFGNNKEKMQMIPKKWRYLINSPFKISDECCNKCKKQILKDYEKKTKNKPYIGMMCSESSRRKFAYLKQGCNVFEGNYIHSSPISFWNDDDVWAYIKKYKLEYSDWYKLGYTRSGCFECLFGIQHEKEPNRIQMMQLTHPSHYKYCIEKLHYDKILSYLNIPYKYNWKQKTLVI